MEKKITVGELKKILSMSSDERRKMIDEATVLEIVPEDIRKIDEGMIGGLPSRESSVEDASVDWVCREIHETERIIEDVKLSMYFKLISLESRKAEIRATEGKIEGLEKKLEILNETRNRLLADVEQQEGRVSNDAGRTEPTSGNRKTD